MASRPEGPSSFAREGALLLLPPPRRPPPGAAAARRPGTVPSSSSPGPHSAADVGASSTSASSSSLPPAPQEPRQPQRARDVLRRRRGGRRRSSRGSAGGLATAGTAAAVAAALLLLFLGACLRWASFRHRQGSEPFVASSLSSPRGGLEGAGGGMRRGEVGAARTAAGAEAIVGGARDPREASKDRAAPCPYRSINDLTDEERHPRASRRRHMVDPPRRPIPRSGSPPEGSSNRLTLVCCHTTQGPWSVAVHEAWAPIGSQRFLDMVTSNYFQGNDEEKDSAGVPLMRCIRNYLCQFGLAGKRSERFQDPILDDPVWLPEGPDHRTNSWGVTRFQKGYLSYAGNGPHRRTNQLFVALGDNGPLGGGSPWEVPWGELVGNHSFETLDRIYRGYGGKGPTQQRLAKPGALPAVRRDFPLLDWVLSCHVVDEVHDNAAGVATNND